jgi:hypothetical protein
METYDILLIRACKSKEPFKRIYSLYKRKYYNNDHYYNVMINDLSKICDKYNLCTIETYNNKFSDNLSLHLLYNEISNLGFNDIKKIQMNTLMHIIRYISIDRFDNFIPPKKFKK